MKASKKRIVPTLEQTSIFHGPAQQAKASAVNTAALANNVSLANAAEQRFLLVQLERLR